MSATTTMPESARASSKAGRPSLLRIPPGLVIVVLVVVALAIWRIAYVMAGPDPDSDAYGHHTIARQILVDPKNLSVHWVWLPLFHYLQAIAVWFGATLDTVRFFNVAVSAAVPVLLYLTLQGNRAALPKDGKGVELANERNSPTPAIAAVLCALAPIAMQMGTTGQTEPLFALLAMTGAFALCRRRHVVLSICLTAGVLLRYEAWAILCGVIGLTLVERVVPRLRGKIGLRIPPIPLWVLLPPVLAILGWAALRRPVDGAWFWFLKGTREFANGALGAKSSFELGRKQLIDDLLRYAVTIPYRVLGDALYLAPIGLYRMARVDGLRFVTIFLSVLGFVTFAWVMRSSLGLDRHFVALVPLYAAAIANGAVQIADLVFGFVRRMTKDATQAFLAPGSARAAVVAGFACALFVSGYQRLDEWMMHWRHASEDVWADRRFLAGFLTTLPAGSTIFCDEATVEVFSGLDRRRFERIGVHDAARVQKRAAAEGEVYVVSWAAPLKSMRAIGSVIYRPAGVFKDDEGLMVLRVVRQP